MSLPEGIFLNYRDRFNAEITGADYKFYGTVTAFWYAIKMNESTDFSDFGFMPDKDHFYTYPNPTHWVVCFKSKPLQNKVQTLEEAKQLISKELN